MPSQREARGRANAAHKRDTSAAGTSKAATHEGAIALTGSTVRSHSIELWGAPETGRNKRSAAAPASGAAGSSARHGSGRSRQPAAITDASSSGNTSSSKTQQPAVLEQRGNSSGSEDSSSSDDEEEATCPVCLDALDETDRGLFPCECGYQVRLNFVGGQLLCNSSSLL